MTQCINAVKSIIENKNSSKKIVVLFVGLFFVSDFLTKIFIVYYDASFNRVTGVVKLVFEFIMLFYLFKKGKTNHALFLGLILSIAFLISNASSIIAHNSIDFSAILENIYWHNRYLYIFIFIAFFKLYDVGFSVKDDFIKLFKTVLYINSVLIIIGFLFKIELFRSYPFSSRFGYDGIFSKHGEAAYYHIFFITILYYEYLNNKRQVKLLKIITMGLVSVLLGKKAIFLFLFFLAMLHLVIVLKKSRQVALGLLILGACSIFFKEAFLNVLFKISPFWERVHQNHGFMGMLTSLRSGMLIDFFNYAGSNWNILNYLFGMGEYNKYKVEFEFVDVFMFFGLTGVIAFIYLFKNYFYKNGNIISRYLLASILMTSFFSGALFISVTGMMFFYLVFQWINNSEDTPV